MVLLLLLIMVPLLMIDIAAVKEISPAIRFETSLTSARESAEMELAKDKTLVDT